MYKGRSVFKETHKGPKHTNFSITVLIVHRGWERAKYSQMSLLNCPLLSTSKRYHAGWYQNLLLSHCGLQQRGRGPVPFSTSQEAMRAQLIFTVLLGLSGAWFCVRVLLS